MKNKADTVNVLVNYKSLHISTYNSNPKLLYDVSDDSDQEYWSLCLHNWEEAIFPDGMSHLRNIYETA